MSLSSFMSSLSSTRPDWLALGGLSAIRHLFGRSRPEFRLLDHAHRTAATPCKTIWIWATI